MGRTWAERSLQPERMDLEAFSFADAAIILRNLETINAWLGGVRATLYHLRHFARTWKPGEKIRIIDWGTGGADTPRAIIRWSRKQGFPIEIVGVDSNPTVIEYARTACRDYPEIQLVQEDLEKPPQYEGGFDYAISSLCLHHLSDPQIIQLLKNSDRLAKRGIIMNDLKRSKRAWAWIWVLSRLTRTHPIVQDDGPLSVRRAFRPNELESLARQAGLNYLNVKTHFGYRLTLAGEKPPLPASGHPPPAGEGTTRSWLPSPTGRGAGGEA
jgi:SAM-dependent methyltransferase